MRKPGAAARRGVWALARFLHRKQLPGEREKNALAGCQLRLLVPKSRIPSALCPLDKAFFSFSPALGTHGAQKRAKAHPPPPPSRPRAGFLHTLRLSSLCLARGGTPRLHATARKGEQPVVGGPSRPAKTTFGTTEARWHRLSSLCLARGETRRLQRLRQSRCSEHGPADRVGL